MSRTKSAGKHHLSFGRYCDVMSGKHGTSWQPYEALRQAPPVVPPVADGPGVSLISACGDGEPDAYSSTCRYVGKPGTGKISRAETKRSQTLSCALPRDNSPHRQWSPGETRTTNITRHEAEPAFSVARSSLPHPYMRWTQQWIQTMMQIYASAARLRSSGAHSCIRHEKP
jgi:hypothetical protein